jgi:hypothetical protein
MNVNTGKRLVPINMTRQPSGWENPPPLKVAPTDIMSGPNSHIPTRANSAASRRFSVFNHRFQPMATTRAVVIGRRTVRTRTSKPENRYPRSQCRNTSGAQKLNPPRGTYFNAPKVRFWFTDVSARNTRYDPVCLFSRPVVFIGNSAFFHGYWLTLDHSRNRISRQGKIRFSDGLQRGDV